MTPPILRPYQIEAINAARQAMKSGKKAVLLVAFCGAGKTVMAAEVIRSAVSLGSRTLFLAHRRELIRQTQDKLRSFGVEPGIIMAGERMDLARPCQVASIQTLAQRRDVLTDVDLVFFDEAHHAAAKSYQDIVKMFPKSRVIGLTATPWRTDGKGLSDIFDSHCLVATPAQLRDGGWLCPVGGWEFRAVDTTGAKVQGGDFVQSSMSDAAQDKKLLGSIVGEYVARAKGKRAVCFCVSVAASEATALAFREAGVAAEHLDGETPKDERDAILDRLRSGETHVVCNCAVLTEGTDIPSIEVCILAAPTLSPVLYLQRVGRVLRPAPGKEKAIIHDHCKALATHGHPYADRDFAPCEADPGKSVNRRRKDAEQKVKTCKSCGSVRNGYPCESCGYSPSTAEIAEELAVEAVAIAEQQKDAETIARAVKFKQLTEPEKQEAFMRMVSRHGRDTRRSVGVYRWASGDTEWPPREWQREAGIPAASPSYFKKGG